MKNRIITLGAVAVAVAAALTGCASASTVDAVQHTPQPTITSTPNPAYTPPSGQCEEGVATITADVADVQLPDGCARVDAVTSGSQLALGAVPTLQVEGDNNTVSATAVEELTVLGSGNTVSYTGDPEIDDQGHDNTLTKVG